MSMAEDYLDSFDIEEEYARIQNEAERGVWTMRDGTVIRVEDMTSSHIKNAKALCERNNAYDLYTPWVERFTDELRKRGESNE